MCHKQTDAIFVMIRFQSFDLLYNGKLVVDSFRIVELLQICYGFVVELLMKLFEAFDLLRTCCGLV